MTWLLPLGFLGLAGVIALIVIYIIKPNYQNKYISSTYVWRLSLKYRKKRLPLNKLNNILQFLCQCLILTICGLLLAQPVIVSEKVGDENEKVIIIDASASMLMVDAGTTRFDRAVDHARVLAEDTFEKGGVVTIIYADAEAEFLAQRHAAENADELYAMLDALLVAEEKASYTSADLKGAAVLAEEVLRYNSEAQVYLLTGTTYVEKHGIIVESMASENDWNAAVLNCTAKLNDNNHYEIYVDLGCYGRTELVTVHLQVHGANGKPDKTAPLTKTEFFDPTSEEKTVTFTTDDFGGVPLYSFDYLEVYVAVADSFPEDNAFFLYGGQKQQIKVLYASSKPNNYFGGIVRTFRESMKDKWDIEFKELKADEKAPTQGYDFYIYEHRMPDVLPTDGLVLLVDPNKAPDGAGFRVGYSELVNSNSTLAAGNPHDLMNFVESSRVTIAKYNDILSSDGYQELAYYNGRPVILAKNEPDAKVVIWAFDLNFSNLIAMPDFSFMMYNMFNYYIPTTMASNAFEIGDTVHLTCRGSELKVSGMGEEIAFEGSSGELVVNRPGTYTVTQKPMQGEALVIENFFVRIPNVESHITKQVDELPMIDVDKQVEVEFEDLLFYFAIGLVTLMFAEWYLQSKKSM